MEDDKLNELFNDFHPNLSPDSCFMSKLEDSLDKVEFIRQHNFEMRKRSKKAVVIAALSGFITGIIFMLLVPYTDNIVRTFKLSIPQFGPDILFLSYNILTWIIAAFLSVVSALTAYDITILRAKTQPGRNMMMN